MKQEKFARIGYIEPWQGDRCLWPESWLLHLRHSLAKGEVLILNLNLKMV